MLDKIYQLPSGAQWLVQKIPNRRFSLRDHQKKTTHFTNNCSLLQRDSQNAEMQLPGMPSSPYTQKKIWIWKKGNKRILAWPGGSLELEASDLSEQGASSGGSLKPLKLTMPGKVLSIQVKEGDVVVAGQALLIVEAMKMENQLLANAKAKIQKIHVKEGDRLDSGSTLISFEAAKDA